MYRGTLGGYTVEVIGCGRLGSDTQYKVIEGVRGMNIPVIVHVLEDCTGNVYQDISANALSNRRVDEPITPGYIRELIAARKGKIGPAVAKLNGEIISRADELGTNGYLHVHSDIIMSGVSCDLGDVISAFKTKGFEIVVSDGMLEIKVSK